MLALALGAFAVLSLASVATFEAVLPGHAAWDSPNAGGPVGAALALGLVWSFGRIAAFGVPLLCALWSWNRLRGKPATPLIVTSLLAALLVFELCTLLGLADLDRWVYAGGWGFASALVLRSALGVVGSWIVAGALFGVTTLAASELGLHWIGPVLRAIVLGPVAAVAAAIRHWQERRAAAAKAAPKAKREPKPRKEEGPKVVRSGIVEAEPKAKIAVATPSAAQADEAHAAKNGRLAQLDLPGLPPKIKQPPKPKPASAVVDPHPDEAFPSLSLLQMPPQQEDLITASDLTA